MGFACCFGITGIAKTFVPLFFGAGYEPVVNLLYVFSAIIVIIGISNCLGSQYYTPCGKRRESTKYLITGSFSNLVLIPRLGAKGAAIASVIAEFIISALYIKFSSGYGNISMLFRTENKKMFAGMLMFIIVFFFNELQFNSLFIVVLQIVIGSFSILAR